MGVIDMRGMRFEKLTVISRAPNDASGSAWWNVLCDCGKETIAKGSDLRLGRKKSCGCLKLSAYSEQRLCEYCGNPVMSKNNRFCSTSCSAKARCDKPRIEVDESFSWKKTSGNRWKCRFGYKNISCTDRDCAHCGWNPAVEEKRTADIQRKLKEAAV